MKKLLIVIVTFALLCVTATVTFGYPFQIFKPGLAGYGARANAMGGAFTAVADDGFAPYYNPAGMTQLKALAITGDLGFTGFEESEVMLISGFGGITTSSLAANVYFDELVDSEGSSIGTFNYVLSAATTLFTKAIAVGGNVKLVSDVWGYSDGFSESENGVAFDLAGLIKPTKFLSIGVMGRNINEPTIENTEDTLFSSLVVGLALKPSSSTTLAADLEMMKLTEFDKLNLVHFGLEQTALWNSIALRLGVSGNPEYFADTQVISGGFGLKILGVYADMAVLDLTGDYPSIEFSGGFRY